VLTIALLATLAPTAHSRAAEEVPELSARHRAIAYDSLFLVSGSHQLYAEAGACAVLPPVVIGGDSPCPEASPAESEIHVGARMMPAPSGGSLTVAPIPAWLTDRQVHSEADCGRASSSVLNTAGVAYSLTGTPGGLTASGSITGRHQASLRTTREAYPSNPFCLPGASGLTDHMTSGHVTMTAPFILEQDALVELVTTLMVTSAPLDGDNTMEVTVSVADLTCALEGDASALPGGDEMICAEVAELAAGTYSLSVTVTHGSGLSAFVGPNEADFVASTVLNSFTAALVVTETY
jgi:hypothetical protein